MEVTTIFFWIIRHTFPPQIWEKNGGASYRLNVAHLGGGASGVGSQEAGSGSPLQEARGGRNGEMVQALGWEEGVSQQWEAREAGAKSPLWHTIVLGRRVQAVQTC